MLRLYTDESPGLKVDPVVVLVLSLVFIFSVVALHSEFFLFCSYEGWWKGELGTGVLDVGFWLTTRGIVIAKITRKFSS